MIFKANDVDFSIVDIETTGVSSRSDRIVEIAVVRCNSDGSTTEWNTLISPGRPMGATHVHGITEEDVAGKPQFAEVIDDFLEATRGSVLVAHNLKFERSFFVAEFERAGRALPAWASLCTLELARKVLPDLRKHTLASLCELLELDRPQHRALDDARSTAQLLNRLSDTQADRMLAEMITSPFCLPKAG